MLSSKEKEKEDARYLEEMEKLREILFVKKTDLSVPTMMRYVEKLANEVQMDQEGNIQIKNPKRFYSQKRMGLYLFARAIAHKLDSKVSEWVDPKEVTISFATDTTYHTNKINDYIDRHKFHLELGEGEGITILRLKDTSLEYFYKSLFKE